MQSATLNILKLGKNVFLTGSAGTGKTHILKEYISYLRDSGIFPSILAPTGIAASLLNGKTIHSFFALGIRDFFSDDDIYNIATNPRLKKRFKELKVLIIDEVSMISPTIFSVMDKVLQIAKKNDKSFGGIQIILSGDFFQLPPISRTKDEKRFAWQSPSWKEADLKTCYLTKKYRQNQENSISKVLDNIREGIISQEAKDILDSRVGKSLDIDFSPTKLYTHNIDVDSENQKELDKLDGKMHTYEYFKKGSETNVERMFKNSLVQKTLCLKKDTVVMFIKNDTGGNFVNGTTGKVVGFEKNTDNPIVDISGKGSLIVDAEEFTYENEEGDVLASIIQYPLKLAWAITIHKSQGMTLNAAQIDLSKTFEIGQGYVALSRVRDINGLSLNGYNENSLLVDELILKIDDRIKAASDKSLVMINSYNQIKLHDSQEKYLKKIKPKEMSTSKEKKSSTHLITKELASKHTKLKDLAKERGLTVDTIINHIKKSSTEDKEFDFSHLCPKGIDIEYVKKIKEDILKEGNQDNFAANGSIKMLVIMNKLGITNYPKMKEILLFC
ncbi:MAG: AAA family ATPase [Poseidonibacter sp.]|uniref:AAA family ATPase n=1 Tax=Poseidonibacter sp. TaxID=2321188 RepID=UPI00359CD588